MKRVVSSLDVKTANGCQGNCLQSLYGDAFPPSPRKGRSPVRKFRDRPSPLGPLVKPQSMVCEELNSRVQEQQSATELHSLGSRPPIEVGSVEDGEEVEQMAGSPGVQSRSPVTVPLGVSINFGGAWKLLSNVPTRSSRLQETCLHTGQLPDTRSLRSHLEHRLEMEGLNVSVDCVNLLNNGLDAYLNRLIEPCITLASSKCENNHLKKVKDQLTPGLNELLLGRYMQRPVESVYASMLDFHVAMGTNPRILGENWPMLLEKILLHAFEE